MFGGLLLLVMSAGLFMIPLTGDLICARSGDLRPTFGRTLWGR